MMHKITMISDDWTGRAEKVRHACRGIIIRDGKVLLSYEARNDIFMIPGGGIEQGETQEQCCAREILEETGVICRVGEHYLDIEELFEVWQHFNHYFACELIEETGELHLTAGEAKAQYTFVWMPLRQALDTFGAYERFHKFSIANYGLYRREYTALREYTEHFGIDIDESLKQSGEL